MSQKVPCLHKAVWILFLPVQWNITIISLLHYRNIVWSIELGNHWIKLSKKKNFLQPLKTQKDFDYRKTRHCCNLAAQYAKTCRGRGKSSANVFWLSATRSHNNIKARYNDKSFEVNSMRNAINHTKQSIQLRGKCLCPLSKRYLTVAGPLGSLNT